MTEFTFFLPNMGMTAGGFNEKLKKMSREHCVFERMDVFSTQYGLREYYWLFWPIIKCSFHRIDVFLPNMGMRAGGFSWKIWKNNDMRAQWFCENGRFLTKYGHGRIVFFREWTFFWQNMGMRAVSFSWEIGNKRASYWLYWPII